MSEDAAAKRRARQTVNNLVLALIASLGIMLAIILIVPRDDSNRIQKVDYKSIALEAHGSSGKQIVAPELPAGWWANSARWSPKPVDGVQNWYVGFVGPKNQYIGLTQAFGINPTWLALQLKNNSKTGTQAIGAYTWDIYEATEPNDPVKTKDFMMVLNYNPQDVAIIYGVAKPQDFVDIATAIQTKLMERGN
ncbi:MAG: hypothetical protein RL036_363 [Actinomycetota bacterium]|jgi:hypothetical protein